MSAGKFADVSGGKTESIKGFFSSQASPMAAGGESSQQTSTQGKKRSKEPKQGSLEGLFSQMTQNAKNKVHEEGGEFVEEEKNPKKVKEPKRGSLEGFFSQMTQNAKNEIHVEEDDFVQERKNPRKGSLECFLSHASSQIKSVQEDEVIVDHQNEFPSRLVRTKSKQPNSNLGQNEGPETGGGSNDFSNVHTSKEGDSLESPPKSHAISKESTELKKTPFFEKYMKRNKGAKNIAKGQSSETYTDIGLSHHPESETVQLQFENMNPARMHSEEIGTNLQSSMGAGYGKNAPNQYKGEITCVDPISDSDSRDGNSVYDSTAAPPNQRTLDEEDLMRCDQCGKSIPVWEMPEHQDYHFALSLQNQPQTLNTPTVPRVTQTQTGKRKYTKQNGGTAKKSKVSNNTTMHQFFKKS